MKPIELQTALLNWFADHAREMPWRENQDPYRIWVSEIMLQQTQVKTVHAYFLRFMQAFPSLADLAAAPEAQVLKAWEGLGYYSRARNLHRGSRYVMEECGGQIPDQLNEILKVPGIGPYSAGAILSIAFKRPVPAIDGNVIRVFSRLDCLPEAIVGKASQERLRQRVQALIPAERPGDFNQALMELGALVCTPRHPDCEHCPLQTGCRAHKAGNPEAYPIKGKKTEVKTRQLAVVYLQNAQGQMLLQHQQNRGIFRNLWCLPWIENCVESSGLKGLAEMLKADLGLEPELTGPLGEVEHRLTHRLLKMEIYTAYTDQVSPSADLPTHLAWVEPDHPEHAMPKAHQKILSHLQSQPLLLG